MHVDRKSATPLPQQIADHLRHRIRSQQLPAGSHLPGHRWLAAYYGVSLATIKSAIEVLEAEGLLYTHASRGTFVAEALPRSPLPCTG